MKSLATALVAAALVASSAPAFAQGSAEAAELFKQGRAALEQKDYVTACTKLAESNRIERAVGTLISLAQCHEGQNKLAAARQYWQEAGDLADAVQDRLARGAPAREKVAELDKKIGRVTVKPAPGAPAGMSVKRDDVVLTSASFGGALPIDVGRHTFVVSAEGLEPKTFDLEIAAGESKDLVIETGPALPPPPPPVTPPPSEGSTSPSSSSSMKTAGFIVGGVGILGLGLGTIFGLSAKSNWDDAQSACRPGACGPGSEAQNLKDSASSSGTLSTIAFVVGGAALATGIVLLVVAPPSRSSSTSARLEIVPGIGGISVAGSL